MIINQNILGILTTFSDLQRKIYETFYTKETTSKAAITEFLSKILNREKISNKQLNLCEAKIFLDEIIKSMNSQTNEYPGNDGLTEEFYESLGKAWHHGCYLF